MSEDQIDRIEKNNTATTWKKVVVVAISVALVCALIGYLSLHKKSKGGFHEIEYPMKNSFSSGSFDVIESDLK